MTKDVNERILASMMVGREVLFDKLEKKGQQGDVQIEVKDLHVADNRGLLAVRGVDLQVHAGEILGIAAIEGNGQSELLEAITGMRNIQAGEVLIKGTVINGKDPGVIRRPAHIPRTEFLPVFRAV
ncbi:MAG: ATP-binding cassette domain-containing protein [Clostridia bacterium]